MASRAAAGLPNANPSPPIACHLKPPKPGTAAPLPPLPRTTRRAAAATALTAAFLAGAAPLLDRKPARSFEFGFTAPDQTVKEAEAGIKVHSRGLLQLRPLVESKAWRELQLGLRESSPLLKQDLYTIIQSKPGELRPVLRNLYSNLFNNVTRLDYAARSKDAILVQEYYQNIVATLEEILGKI